MFRRIAAFALALLLAVSLTGCTTYNNFHAAFFEPPVEEENIIRIGIYEPLTGPDADEASEEIKGMELAHEMFPDLDGVPVELVYADNQSDLTEAPGAARELAESGVRVVLGSYRSTLSLAASDIFEEYRLPAIAATCTNPLVTQTNEFYFRSCFIDAYQGISAARYIYEGLGQKDIVCFKRAGDDYADAMIEQVRVQAQRQAQGSGKVTVIEFPEGAENMSVYYTRLTATEQRAIFYPCTAEEGDAVLKDTYGLGLKWVGCSKWEALTNLAVAAADPSDHSYLYGVTYVKGFDPDSSFTPMTERFKAAYAAKYGEEAPSENCALGFDAYLMALEGIRLAGDSNDGVILASKLKSIRGLEGATGYISINAQGDPSKDVVLETITKEGALATFTVTPN